MATSNLTSTNSGFHDSRTSTGLKRQSRGDRSKISEARKRAEIMYSSQRENLIAKTHQILPELFTNDTDVTFQKYYHSVWKPYRSLHLLPSEIDHSKIYQEIRKFSESIIPNCRNSIDYVEATSLLCQKIEMLKLLMGETVVSGVEVLNIFDNETYKLETLGQGQGYSHLKPTSDDEGSNLVQVRNKIRGSLLNFNHEEALNTILDLKALAVAGVDYWTFENCSFEFHKCLRDSNPDDLECFSNLIDRLGVINGQLVGMLSDAQQAAKIKLVDIQTNVTCRVFSMLSRAILSTDNECSSVNPLHFSTEFMYRTIRNVKLNMVPTMEPLTFLDREYILRFYFRFFSWVVPDFQQLFMLFSTTCIQKMRSLSLLEDSLTDNISALSNFFVECGFKDIKLDNRSISYGQLTSTIFEDGYPSVSALDFGSPLEHLKLLTIILPKYLGGHMDEMNVEKLKTEFKGLAIAKNAISFCKPPLQSHTHTHTRDNNDDKVLIKAEDWLCVDDPSLVDTDEFSLSCLNAEKSLGAEIKVKLLESFSTAVVSIGNSEFQCSLVQLHLLEKLANTSEILTIADLNPYNEDYIECALADLVNRADGLVLHANNKFVLNMDAGFTGSCAYARINMPDSISTELPSIRKLPNM